MLFVNRMSFYMLNTSWDVAGNLHWNTSNHSIRRWTDTVFVQVLRSLVFDLHLLFLVPGISNAEARQPGKAPNFSVNWTVGDLALEVINATTGKDDMGRASRLCKNALYNRWVRLHSKVNTLNSVQHFSLYQGEVWCLALLKSSVIFFLFLWFWSHFWPLV